MHLKMRQQLHTSMALSDQRPPEPSSFHVLQDSWKFNATGSLTVMSKSYNPYQFSQEGLIKANGTLSYKVSSHACARVVCWRFPGSRVNFLQHKGTSTWRIMAAHASGPAELAASNVCSTSLQAAGDACSYADKRVVLQHSKCCTAVAVL